MKDDVVRFRKICRILIEGKAKTQRDICAFMNLSAPSLARLLTAPIDESFHLRASTLGAIQDFNKHYCSYERLNLAKLPADKPTGEKSFEPAPGLREDSVRDIVAQMNYLLGLLPKGSEIHITLKSEL